MTSETEEAVARVEDLVGLAAQVGDLTLNIGDLKAMSTLLSALAASQAEVERLTRERDEASDGVARWMIRMSKIREAAGVGARPMLEELPGEVAAILARAQAAEARATRAEQERDALHLAICGGEDAPGYAASLSHETVLKVLADNYASAKRDSELAWDGETANTWKARATRAEGLLEEAGEVLEGLANYTVDGVVLAEHSRTFAAARAFLDKLKEQGQ